jgi:drug/metabolite transporter (DMT)-like permease
MKTRSAALPGEAAKASRARLIGIALMCGAVGTFSCLDTTAKFVYSQLVWVIALGYAVFGDRPDAYTLAGASIVIASGLYVFHRERVRGTRTARSLE